MRSKAASMTAENQGSAEQSADKSPPTASPQRPKAPRPPGKPITIVKRGLG